MTDDLHLRLAELYPDESVIPLATATLPAAGMPAGSLREVLALAALSALSHFGGLPLHPRAEAPHVHESVGPQWSEGELPDGLGLVMHGQTPDTQDVLRLELAEAGVVPLTGDVFIHDDAMATEVLLRASDAHLAAVRVFGRGSALIIALRPDRRVELLKVAAAGERVVAPSVVDVEGEALATLTAHPPPIARWSEGAAVQDWLRDACEQLLASPWALDHLTAAGLLGRLWTPSDPEVRRRAILGTFTPPGHHARTWLVALPAAALDAAERAAMREAERIEERIDAPGDAAETLSLALRRDDLESVRAALALADHGTRLGERLRALDTHGRASWSMHPVDDRVRESERLRCVRWSAPDSWWSRFVEA